MADRRRREEKEEGTVSGKLNSYGKRQREPEMDCISTEQDDCDEYTDDDFAVFRPRHKLRRMRPETYKMDICSSLQQVVERAFDRMIPLMLSSLTKQIHEVMRTEVLALALQGSAEVCGRIPPSSTEQKHPDGGQLQLRFRTRLSQPIFTDRDITGEHGAAIQVVLFDENSHHYVTSWPESSVRLNVVVLDGDFNYEDDGNWTPEEFDSHVVKEREGRRPLLAGKVQLTLKEGLATLNDLKFTDNSSWVRSKKFSLGVKVATGYCEGIRIREAKSEAFSIRDHRGERYRKHYPPACNDEVWRLENIAKDGKAHKILSDAKINTVEDFRRCFVRDPAGLNNLLINMPNKKWDALIKHAMTCAPSRKLYYFSPDDDEQKDTGVILNNFYELISLVVAGQPYSVAVLSESQKIDAKDLEKKAHCNWTQIDKYDDKTHTSSKQNSSFASPQTDSPCHRHSSDSFSCLISAASFLAPDSPQTPLVSGSTLTDDRVDL